MKKYTFHDGCWYDQDGFLPPKDAVLMREVAAGALELANAYYTVSADLRRRGESALEQAENLGKFADHLCEQNMRETPLAKTGSPASANEGS